MRAIQFDQFHGPVHVRDVPDPTAPDDGVVVQVHATGLCLSDWHAWSGHDTDITTLPHVPGHELAGTITQVGPDVTRWHVGDRVTVPFVSGCGTCHWCRTGQAQVCPHQTQPGFTHWGSYAELVALHAADANLVAVPDDLTLQTAASLGCRFATAYRALAGRAQVTAGEWVVVLGAGGVGLSTVMIAVARGAHVIAVDRNPTALQAAHHAGAEHTLLTDPTALAAGLDVPAAVHELTGGGAHVAVDAVGNEQACADAILSLRRRGRHVQVGLFPPVDGGPRVPMGRVIAWELDLLGSHGMAAADYPEMLDLVASGALRPQDLLDRVVGLAEAARLLPTMDTAPRAGMVVLDPRRP
ncbi:alcohol dehydrogenase catalytic domain-containing protein [Promicromonospora thailandica]|uniref:Alcohol dehydrogenase n=1 Tax=Promicromonospora thailandica TaxID=765201 RepID=A0A9X2JWQ2_9MICO|nr:alcohol dehydrogenase catalytic domain-containing protein [Promicromonospora thailandica]MCP2265398.1 alcohol dehydrogenase [Promicromonospora thailandica]